MNPRVSMARVPAPTAHHQPVESHAESTLATSVAALAGRRIRVVIDASSVVPGRSGVGIYTEQLVRGLLDLDGGPMIVAVSNKPIDADGDLGGRVHLESGVRLPLRSVWMQFALPSLVRRLDPELCHFPNYLAPVRLRCPTVVTFHDMSQYRYPQFYQMKKRYLARSLLPVVARRARAIHTVSEFSRREIVEILGVPKEKVHVVYGAAPLRFTMDDDPDGSRRAEVRLRYGLPEKYVLCTGTLEPRKNLGRVLAAFESLRRESAALRGTKLVIVGARGWQSGEIVRLLSPLVRRGEALELGYVPAEDLPSLYRMARAFLYPSLYEGFGLPILEAMACGTAVLTSNRASMREVAGDAALLVDPENVAEIRHGLERLLTEPELASEIAARGRERAQRFTWERTAAETLEVYESAVRGTRRRETHSTRAAPARPQTAPGREDLARSILQALHYADLFDAPIPRASLRRNLPLVEVGASEFENCLEGDPGLRQRMARAGDLFFLPGRESLLDLRRARRRASETLLAHHAGLLRQLCRLPFVRMVALSGGSSQRNSVHEEDIDLFVVTAPGRSALAFAGIVLWSRFRGSRRIICANYFVDTAHLRIPNAGDLFTAHQLLHLEPLSAPEWHAALLRQNPWVYDLYPNAPREMAERSPIALGRAARIGRAVRFARTALEIVPWPGWVLAERCLRSLIAWRQNVKASRRDGADLIVRDGILKLHLQDNRRTTAARYRERLQSEQLWTRALEPHLALDADPTLRAQRAWDQQAAEYDAIEDGGRVLRALRARFQACVARRCATGQRVLDLGCGTGRDALWLRDRGVHVTALDVSPKMLAVLNAKLGAPDGNGTHAGRIERLQLSIDDLDRLLPAREGHYDGALLDFGTLNIASDAARLRNALARLVRPDGFVVAAAMNRTCAWERLHFLLRLRFAPAGRRGGRGPRLVPVAGEWLPIQYSTPRELEQIFAPEFEVVEMRAHGVVLPPPFLESQVARWPGLLRGLAALDARASRSRVAARFADHVLVVWRRRSEGMR